MHIVDLSVYMSLIFFKSFFQEFHAFYISFKILHADIVEKSIFNMMGVKA